MSDELENSEETVDHESTLQESTLNAIEEAFDEAQQKLEQSGELNPFTVIVTEDGFEIDEHPGETPEECFAAAKQLVKDRQASAYVFCYDGYVELEDEEARDAIICEAADMGDAEVYAAFYIEGEDGFAMEENLYDLGEKESFLA